MITYDVLGRYLPEPHLQIQESVVISAWIDVELSRCNLTSDTCAKDQSVGRS